MFEFAINFLTLHVHNATLPVHVVLLGVWLMLLASGVWSVLNQPKGTFWKIIWISMLILLPWAGLFLYSARCVLVSDFAFLKPLGLGAKKPLAVDARPVAK